MRRVEEQDTLSASGVAGNVCVKNATVYGETHINPTTCAPLGAALINGLTPAKVNVQLQGRI